MNDTIQYPRAVPARAHAAGQEGGTSVCEVLGPLPLGAQGKNKSKGHTVVVKEAERTTAGNVINLMEAPKRNIEGMATAKGKRPAAGSGEKVSDAMRGLLESDDRRPCAA